MEDLAIGIDLGTTNSCAVLYKNGELKTVRIGYNLTIPSCVALLDDRFVCGYDAQLRLQSNPKNTIYGVKRFIGKKFDDDGVQSDIRNWRYTVKGVNNEPRIVVVRNGKEEQYRPEEISAMMLLRLKRAAEDQFGQIIKNAVTVPAHFNANQRESTKIAGTLAGFNVLRVLNEPTAAALTFNRQNYSPNTNVLVFDLGGGTFNVTILRARAGRNFEVLSTDGDLHLGGENFLTRMVDKIIEEMGDEGAAVRSDPAILYRLTVACEQAKDALSESEEVPLNFGRNDRIIRRDWFEKLNQDLFDKTIEYVQKAIDKASISKTDLNDIVLVGGSIRITKLQEMLHKYFGNVTLNLNVDCATGIAEGAAICAAEMCSTYKLPFSLHDVISHSLGTNVVGGNMSVLVGRNTRIPIARTKMYWTIEDYQTKVNIDVYEGEDKLLINNVLLGKYQLTIPPRKMNEVGIEVTFSVDKNGIFEMKAKEDADGEEIAEVVISKETFSMGEDEIERKKNEIYDYSPDGEKRKDVEAAKRGLRSFGLKLKEVVEMAYPQEKISKRMNDKFGAIIRKFEKWYDENPDKNREQYRQKLEVLRFECSPMLYKLRVHTAVGRIRNDRDLSGDEDDVLIEEEPIETLEVDSDEDLYPPRSVGSVFGNRNRNPVDHDGESEETDHDQDGEMDEDGSENRIVSSGKRLRRA